jgi:hypothetical protein
MATKSKINTANPIEVARGGLGVTSNTEYAVLCGGTTATDPIQSIASVGSVTEVLTSQGAGLLPTFSSLPTFFESLSSDPGSPTAGDTWYNTTTDLFKGAISGGPAPSVWVIKANLTFTSNGPGSAGSANDALTFGGSQAGGTGPNGRTERYNGVSNIWTTKATESPNRGEPASCGTAEDALSAGGYPLGGSFSKTVIKYNGTSDSWSLLPDLIGQRRNAGAAGTITEAFVFGGSDNFRLNTTEFFDGISWVAKAIMLRAAEHPVGTGTAMNALASTGNTSISNFDTFVEEYDFISNSWTGKSGSNKGRNAAGGCGDTSLSLLFGGVDALSILNNAELYDGATNSWAIISSLNYARYSLGGSGSGTDGLAVGGVDGSGPSQRVERYTSVASPSIVTFTVT